MPSNHATADTKDVLVSQRDIEEDILMDYDGLIQHLRDSEVEVVVKELAMAEIMLARMVPRFEKNCISKFQSLAWEYSKKLVNIASVGDFDMFHKEFVTAFREQIKSENGDSASYGEAQKPINLFLKSYVDRFAIPGEITARILRPFLHVPLDKVVTSYFRSHFREDHNRFIAPVHREINQLVKAKNPGLSARIPDSFLSQLKYIEEDEYSAWQNWFRQIYPERPVLLDNVWFFERPKAKSL